MGASGAPPAAQLTFAQILLKQAARELAKRAAGPP
jgi:hypothetical protein